MPISAAVQDSIAPIIKASLQSFHQILQLILPTTTPEKISELVV